MNFLNLLILPLIIISVAGAGSVDRTDDIRFIREQAEAGDAEAQFSLALMLDQGETVEQDQQQAVYWLTRAAEQNLAGACLYLALKYEHGVTVKPDPARAENLYRKAALQGWPSAQYFLGMLFLHKGEEQENRIQAYTWLSLAAEQEYHGAKEEKDKLSSFLSEKERKEAKKMIQNYYTKQLNPSSNFTKPGENDVQKASGNTE